VKTRANRRARAEVTEMELEGFVIQDTPHRIRRR
jgi:hypothetical protein